MSVGNILIGGDRLLVGIVGCAGGTGDNVAGGGALDRVVGGGGIGVSYRDISIDSFFAGLHLGHGT